MGGSGTAARLIVIAGPTASGKSALALAIAERLEGVVINADAMQVYRELRILTARPGPRDEARIPHRLFGVLPASEICTAARWRDLAGAEIAAAHASGKRPIIVGGTGLYLRVLLHGIAPIPEIPEDIRAAARDLHAEAGADALHTMLARVDPAAAARVPPGDSQRLIRAWEVHAATGKSLSAWQQEHRAVPDLAYDAILLLPARDALYQICDRRLCQMLDVGALAEVEALAKLSLAPSLPAMKAVGVREFMGYLRGAWSIEHALERAQRATRQFAKRQYTWFRHQMADAHVYREQYSSELLPRVFSKIS